jgi:hypothetical protein
MSEKTTQAVALQLGFYNGVRVKPGKEFTVTGKMPKWAAPKGEVAVRATGKPVRMGDTKPKDAQEAVKRKTAGINEQVVGGLV